MFYGAIIAKYGSTTHTHTLYVVAGIFSPSSHTFCSAALKTFISNLDIENIQHQILPMSCLFYQEACRALAQRDKSGFRSISSERAERDISAQMSKIRDEPLGV